MKIEQAKALVAAAKARLNKRQLEKEFYTKQYEVLLAEKQKLILKRELLEKIRILFQVASEHAREQAKVQLETLVTNALQFVFGSFFKFEIKLKEHGGQPVADFFVTTEWQGKIICNRPQDARGGGVVDLLSLALRTAFLESMQPRFLGPLILDEPGKHLSEEYIEQMVEFLRSISTTFKRQILLVTHNVHLVEAADAAYMVDLQGGNAVVTERELQS
ncbi:MAG: hypothetical protein RLZ12_27 [Bacillota bacterium]|jgi:DNA repair exonuclease SbcCD ATPase subunit